MDITQDQRAAFAAFIRREVAPFDGALQVMDFAEGRILTDQTLPDWRARGLEGFGRDGGYVERQIERWTRQYRASETGRIDAMERLIDWLPAHVPPQESTSLVHGDFRLDNLVFHARPRPGGHPALELPPRLNMFRLAVIQQGVARRALDGNAANSRPQAVANRVQATAESGWRAAVESQA